MKKPIVALLLAALLVQTVPTTALAATGEIITAAELNRAFRLAGLEVHAGGSVANGADAVSTFLSNADATLESRPNSGYHEGMTPEESWDAQMLLDWIRDTMDDRVNAISDVFLRAEALLDRMRAEDPDLYASLTGSGGYGAEYLARCRSVAENAESTRQLLLYYEDRLNAHVTMIDQMSELLETEALGSDLLFDHDRIRLSEKIKAASSGIEEIRKDIVLAAIIDLIYIETWESVIAGTYSGDDAVNRRMHDWLGEIFAWEEGPVEASVPASALQPASTRMSRMAAGARPLAPLANDSDATITVITENDLCFRMIGEGNQPVEGVKVTIRDLANESAQGFSLFSDEEGKVIFNANDFTADNDKVINLSLDVLAEPVGYRDFYAPDLEIKRGAIRREAMVKLTGPETSADAAAAPDAENDGEAKPYVWSAIFKTYDVMRSDWKMLYSELNDMDFDIVVTVKNPGGGSYDAPVLHYMKYNGTTGKLSEHTVNPASRSGDVYTFRGPWKQLFTPEIDKEQRPWFTFGKNGTERFQTRIVPTRSKVDGPTQTGTEPTSPLSSLLAQGFGFRLKIPVVDINVDLQLPLNKAAYWPKIVVDPLGSVTVSFGSDMTSPKSSAANWKNNELKGYEEGMKAFEKEAFLARTKNQLGTAYDYYKTCGMAFMAKSKIDFGWFLMVSGRWQKDEDDGSTQIGLSGMTGLMLKYSFDFTKPFALFGVPMYINFNFGISAGFGIDVQCDMLWRGWELANIRVQVPRALTINVRVALTATLGFGIKGIASVWVSCTGCLNVALNLVVDRSPWVNIDFTAFVTVGGELLWIKASRRMYEFPKWQIYPPDNSLAMFAMMQANAGDEDPEIVDPVSQQPDSYPNLAPEATRVFENRENTQAGIKVATCSDKTFAFYLADARNNSDGRTYHSVCWTNVTDGTSNTLRNWLGRCSTMHDFGFDVYSDGRFLMLMGCAAETFNDDGTPVDAITSKQNIWCYVVIFTLNVYGELIIADFWESALNPRTDLFSTIDTPRIEGGHVTQNPYEGVVRVELYGSFEGHNASSGRDGYIGVYLDTDRTNIELLSDATVVSAMGEDYERTYLRSGMRNLGEAWHANLRLLNFPSFSWIAVSAPKDGAEGEHAIELFDWDMNIAPISFTRDRTTLLPTITSTDRRSFAVETGNIDTFELVQTLDADGERYAQTLFYTAAETRDEVSAYRLKGLYIAPKEGASTENLTFRVSKHDYDVTLPTGEFHAVTLGSSSYLYWLSTAPQEDEDGPNIWRISAVSYDASTNTMSDVLVLAEFTLPDTVVDGRGCDTVPHDIVLTETGYGFITTAPELGEETTDLPPLSLYRFPISLQTSLDMRGAALVDTIVCPNDFIDVNFSLMNDGNMGVASFDVEVVELVDGREGDVIETLHADCLHPDRSSLTMSSAVAGADTVVRTGRAAFYRSEDYVYSPRQRDWVLQESSTDYAVQGGHLASATPGDSDARYIRSDVLVPGALGSFTGAIRVPAGWAGKRMFLLRLNEVSTYANWLRAAAVSSGAGDLANADDPGLQPLVYRLDEASGRLVLTGDAANDESLRLYAPTIDADEPVVLSVPAYDIDVDHRVYADYYGEDMLDIILVNHVSAGETIHLNCDVYVDDEDTPTPLYLPYDAEKLSVGKTQTITLPLSAVVDATAHQRARIVVSAPGIEETALSNNEFILYLSGSTELRFTRQPADAVAQEGGSASFSVAVGGGVKPYAFQWQVFYDGGWHDLPGATADTLTLENIPYSWDGRKTRCVVTDAAGTTVTSEEATLTVSRALPPTGDSTNLPLYLAVALIALALLAALRRRERRA